jgi:ATP diphosphatase
LPRLLKIDSEEALIKANKKFERRFRHIEKAPGFEAMSLDEKEELWRSVKEAQSD